MRPAAVHHPVHPGAVDRTFAVAAHAWPWLAAASLLVIVAVGLWMWLRRRARRVVRRLRRPAPRYPVVLAHGLLGFDAIGFGPARTDYFRGIADRLERDGCVVHRCRVAKTGSIAARAAELAAFVREIPARRVNIVAHSMGGLDARYALSRLGMGEKVVSLTTIGTPHHGTPLADAGAGLGRRAGLWRALERIGTKLDAFHDLTTARMDAFNRGHPNVWGVLYASVVGAPARKRDVSPILVPTYVWLGESAGGNDGMVPAASQRWGEVLREVAADHFAQIGWSRRFDAVELYLELVRELRARGV